MGAGPPILRGASGGLPNELYMTLAGGPTSRHQETSFPMAKCIGHGLKKLITDSMFDPLAVFFSVREKLYCILLDKYAKSIVLIR